MDGLMSPTAFVLDEVGAERQRQMAEEGWTREHDDQYHEGQMAEAAACYAMNGGKSSRPADPPTGWPWHRSWWKPKNYRRDLVRAAALLVAEVERIDRMAPRGTTVQTVVKADPVPAHNFGDGPDDDFRRELQQIINRYSMENGSNTQDFVLADFLVRVLNNFGRAVSWRDRLRGQSR